MDKPEASTTPHKPWAFICIAALCFVNLTGYLLFSVPHTQFAWGVFFMPVAMLAVGAGAWMSTRRFGHLSERSGMGSVSMLVFFTFVFWFFELPKATDEADIRYEVSSICLADVERSEQTNRICRQIITNHGGYLCSLDLEPMAQCERDLRRATGRD